MIRTSTPVKKALKPKRCRHCGNSFQPISSMSKACSVPCAIALTERDKAKKLAKAKRDDRRSTKQAIDRLKTRSEHLGELQAVFNQWVRLRDFDQPCISCGRFHTGQWHAGHYQGVGREPAIRFEPDNCHRQCKPCNADLSGNLIKYRARLIDKIGLERVLWLEGPHEPLKITVAEIKELKAHYRAKVREMKKAITNELEVA